MNLGSSTVAKGLLATFFITTSCNDIEPQADHVSLERDGNCEFTGFVEYAYPRFPAGKTNKRLVVKFIGASEEQEFIAGQGYEWTWINDSIPRKTLKNVQEAYLGQ